MMEKLLALAGGGSGGGGASDFSTATLTFGANPDEVEVLLPVVFDTDRSFIMVVNDFFEEGETLTLPLYKGNLLLPVGTLPMDGATLTGNAEDIGGGAVLVTGDFSVSWG